MFFRNYSSRLARTLSAIVQAGGLDRLLDTRGVEEMFMMKKLPKNM